MNKTNIIINGECKETTYTKEEINNLKFNENDKTIIEDLIYERDYTKTVPLTTIISNTTDDLINEFTEEYNIEDDIAIEFLILKGIKAIYNE